LILHDFKTKLTDAPIAHSTPQVFRTGCFDDHVSFAVLSIRPSPNGGKYHALPFDNSQNISMESDTNRIVQNLYGEQTNFQSWLELSMMSLNAHDA